MTAPTPAPEYGELIWDLTDGLWRIESNHYAAAVERAAAVIRDLEAENARLRSALERIFDLGSDGEHSGDRHARCRDIARAALSGRGRG